jgi:hypothetical protein
MPPSRRPGGAQQAGDRSVGGGDDLGAELQTPPFCGSFFMTWARWPACSSSQSSAFAVGMNSRSESTLRLWLLSSSLTRYLIRSGLSTATFSIGPMLPGRTCATMSVMRPFFRNFGLNVANGPNSSEVSPSTTRVSRCGTDMGGAPTAACEYTLALCCATTAGLEVFSHCPPIGKTP